MNTKNRNIEFDIIKGFAIILMVMGHTDFWGTSFIYLFHMAVFIIVSGFFYKDNQINNIDSWKKYVIKKFKGLWLPYFTWNSIFLLLNNVFIATDIYTDNPKIANYIIGGEGMIVKRLSYLDICKEELKIILMQGNTAMGGALWFLRVLLYISLLYASCELMLTKIKCKNMFCVQMILSFVFLIIGYVCSIFSITFCGGFERALTCYFLFFFGCCFKRFKYQNTKKYMWMIMALVCFAVLFVCNKYGNISLGNNNFVNPIFLILTSISGFILLLSCSMIIKDFKVVTYFMSYIGKNTLSIMIFHFLCFKIINVIQVIIYKYPKFIIAAFPVINSSGVWYIVYTIIGVIIPVVLVMMKEKVVWLCCKKFNNKIINSNK